MPKPRRGILTGEFGRGSRSVMASLEEGILDWEPEL